MTISLPHLIEECPLSRKCWNITHFNLFKPHKVQRFPKNNLLAIY